MDKYIEILTPYLLDWQQTAIENPQFSAALAVLAFFTGSIITSISKGGKLAALNKQLTNEKQQTEQINTKHEELLTQHRNDTEQIAVLQQQLEQATSELQNEKQQHQSSISNKDELFIKSTSDNQQEIDALNTTITDKTNFAEQLQIKLDQQSENISQHSELQTKLNDIEAQANISASELTIVKQQLETEQINTKHLSEQLNEQKKLANSHLTNISELELELKDTRNIIALNKLEQQLEKQRNTEQPKHTEQKTEPLAAIIEKPTAVIEEKSQETPPLQEEPKPATTTVEEIIIATPEPAINTVKPKTTKPAENQAAKKSPLSWLPSLDDNKITNKLFKSERSSQAEQATTEPSSKPNILEAKPIIEDITQPTHTKIETPIPVIETTVEPSESKTTNPPINQAENKSAAKGILGWFSSLDDALENNSVTGNLFKSENISPSNQQNNDSLDSPNTTKAEPAQIPEKITEAVKPKKTNPKPIANIIDTEESSFSEKLADAADKMDSFQKNLTSRFFKSKN